MHTHLTLVEAVEACDRYYQGKLTSEDREAIREDIRLTRDYPRQFVAYSDEWIDMGRKRVLRRDILAVAETLGELDEMLQARTDLEGRTVSVYAGDEDIDEET